jgi:hypothetical protein
MAGRHYNRAELQMIAIMRKRALSIPTIPRQLGRTPAAIQSALRVRRWVDPARSKVMSSVRIFSPGQRGAFENLSARGPLGTHHPTSEMSGMQKRSQCMVRKLVESRRALDRAYSELWQEDISNLTLRAVRRACDALGPRSD